MPTERHRAAAQILKAFDRALRRRSEKLGSPTIDDEQQAFVFEEIETRHRRSGRRSTRAASVRMANVRRARKGFAPHLERVEVVSSRRICRNIPQAEGADRRDVSERLDVIRRRSASSSPAGGNMPSKRGRRHPGTSAGTHHEGGIPTEALLARSPSPKCRWPAALSAGRSTPATKSSSIAS